MSFNNGLERRKFEAVWKKQRVYYAAEGMSEAAIEEMYQFDLSVFNSDRRYAEHTQGMPSQQFDDDGDTAGEDNSALLVKFFGAFTVMPQETSGADRYGWIDEIDSPELADALRQLSVQDKELLTLPLSTYSFYGTYSADYGTIMAGLLLCVAPILILYVVLQKQIIGGVVAGAVK